MRELPPTSRAPPPGRHPASAGQPAPAGGCRTHLYGIGTHAVTDPYAGAGYAGSQETAATHGGACRARGWAAAAGRRDYGHLGPGTRGPSAGVEYPGARCPDPAGPLARAPQLLAKAQAGPE